MLMHLEWSKALLGMFLALAVQLFLVRITDVDCAQHFAFVV